MVPQLWLAYRLLTANVGQYQVSFTGFSTISYCSSIRAGCKTSCSRIQSQQRAQTKRHGTKTKSFLWGLLPKSLIIMGVFRATLRFKSPCNKPHEENPVRPVLSHRLPSEAPAIEVSPWDAPAQIVIGRSGVRVLSARGFIVYSWRFIRVVAGFVIMHLTWPVIVT